MYRFIADRIIQSLIVVLVISFIIYILLGLMPGDPLDMLVESGPGASPEAVARLRELYGLDQPLMARYWSWLKMVLSGNLGYSRTHSVPVLQIMGHALINTSKLMLASFLLSVCAAFILGVTAALKPGGAIDTFVSFIAFAGISVPVFWLALMMILVFAVHLQWFPASGIPPSGNVIEQLKYQLLPVLTLAMANTGGFIRYVRASAIETLKMDYIRTARAKGNGYIRIVVIHSLRNALIPVVTVMALSFGHLFNGALIVETMFAQPGMGKMIYDSINSNDFNLALCCLLFAAIVTMICNLVADLVYAWLDPRISL